jgi:hypothetical protein
MSATDKDRFLSYLSKWESAYTSATFSIYGLRLQNGLQIMYAHIALQSVCSPTGGSPFQFETEHILARRWTQSIGPGEATKLVSKVAATGELANPNDAQPYRIPGISDQSFPYLDVVRYPFTARFFQRGASLHSIKGTLNIPYDLDSEAKTADAPFDSIDETLTFCGLPSLSQMGDLATIEITAGPPGTIEQQSTITDGTLEIRCRVAKFLNPEFLKLGFGVIRDGGQTTRSSARAREIEWTERTEYLNGVFRFPLGDALLANVYLSYEGILIDHRTIVDPKRRVNLRYEIHQILDPQVELLKEMLLTPDMRRSEAFEYAVSSLFSLLGYSTANYHRIPKLQDGPDIIAFTPAGHVAVIECTLGHLNQNDKLAKLTRRTHQVKQKLTALAIDSSRVQAIIVTALPRKEAESDLGQAAKLQIAVVAREEIETLFRSIPLPPDPDRNFDGFIKLIPPVEKTDAFGS